MNNEQKIDKTSNDLLNIKDDETVLIDIQQSGEDMSGENTPEENTMELTDGMIITPSFYKKSKKSAEEKKDFTGAEDEDSILDLDSQSFLDDEESVDLNAQTIAISKDNLNPSDFLPFTDKENNQDSDLPFDAKTIFAPGGDLDAVEIEALNQVNNTESYDNDPVFELGQEVLDEEHTEEHTIDIDADTISNTESSMNISENEKSDLDKIDELFSEFDTKTIIAPNGDLDSLDFDDPVEEDFDVNAETVIYSESEIDEISGINSEIKDYADENLFSDVNSETIIALPDDPDDNEFLDLDDILDASDINANILDATTLNISENDLSQEPDNFSEEISDSGKIISLAPDTFVEETGNDEELSVRDSTTMDGRDEEDAVISLEEATVLEVDEDMVLELGAEAVIEPIENLGPDLKDIQDNDFKQAAETIALIPDTDENMMVQDEDDILDLDILQSVSSEDYSEDNTEYDIPILTSEDMTDTDHEIDFSPFQDEKHEQENDGDTALDLIDSLGDPDGSSEIEEPEDFLDTLDSDTDPFPSDQDDLAVMLNKGKENIDELTSSISSAQIEASLERVINKIFSERIEKILIKVVEKAVSEEISKFRASLMEDLTDEGNF